MSLQLSSHGLIRKVLLLYCKVYRMFIHIEILIKCSSSLVFFFFQKEGIPELSIDDYFSKNNEFATWLKEEKRTYFNDLTTESARKLFSRFVKAWNSGKLESRYYEGISTAPRTAHNWKIKHRWKCNTFLYCGLLVTSLLASCTFAACIRDLSLLLLYLDFLLQNLLDRLSSRNVFVVDFQREETLHTCWRTLM